MHWANKYRAWTLTAFAGAELNIKNAKPASVENATSNGEDDPQITSDIPNTAEVQRC